MHDDVSSIDGAPRPPGTAPGGRCRRQETHTRAAAGWRSSSSPRSPSSSSSTPSERFSEVGLVDDDHRGPAGIPTVDDRAVRLPALRGRLAVGHGRRACCSCVPIGVGGGGLPLGVRRRARQGDRRSRSSSSWRRSRRWCSACSALALLAPLRQGRVPARHRG